VVAGCSGHHSAITNNPDGDDTPAKSASPASSGDNIGKAVVEADSSDTATSGEPLPWSLTDASANHSPAGPSTSAAPSEVTVPRQSALVIVERRVRTVLAVSTSGTVIIFSPPSETMPTHPGGAMRGAVATCGSTATLNAPDPRPASFPHAVRARTASGDRVGS
jgi:hypothetical protein